jgi:phytoene synthase
MPPAGGGGLFAAAGVLLGAERDPVEAAGRGWALVDLAWHASETGLRAAALAAARPTLAEATGVRWSRAGRPLGMLAHLARRDLEGDPAQPRPLGSPGRVGRALWHAVTGR